VFTGHAKYCCIASEFEQPRVASDPYHTVSLLAADECAA